MPIVRSRPRRPALAAALCALAFLAGCTPRETPPPPPEPSPPPVTPAPAPPPPPPVLGRAELLGAVAQAASATAAGGAYPDVAAALGGRRFSLRLPVGCLGPAGETASGWSYDADRQTLKVVVRPETWTDADWARALVGTPETETIDGFWIRRPWLASEGCPAPGPAEGMAEPETVGFARVFEAGGSRVTRRGGRPYEVTEKAPPDPPPGAGGFRLLLEGRIAEPEDRRPVRCAARHPDRRPVCLVLADIDRVAIEDAQGRRLGDWGN